MKTLRLLGAQRRISVPHLAIFLAIALVLYTVVFCMWRRVSPWAVVRFLMAIVFILYFPGKVLVVAAKLRSGPLEDWALSLVTGMAASTGLYWICALFGVRCLFPLWPLGATGFCLFRGARKWRSVVGCHFPLEMSRVLLAGLVALILVPLFLLPMHYRNMVLLPDGSMSYLDGPADPLIHASVANELTHSGPPQVPFLAGQPLPYHCAMHLLAAMLSDVARLSTLDLMFRFLTTFFLAVTAPAIFCFARIWMGSSYAALLAVFLVIVGEESLIDLADEIALEDEVTLAERVTVLTHVNVGYRDHPLQRHFPSHSKRVVFNRGCFVGTNVTLLPGVRVGECAFVAAGAVVREDVSPYHVVGGVPARTLRVLEAE